MNTTPVTFPPPIVLLALCPRCHGEGMLYPPCPSVAEMVAAPECPDCGGTGEYDPEESVTPPPSQRNHVTP